MRRSYSNSTRKLRWLLLACLLASQAAVAAVPCVSPKAKAPESLPAQAADCREVAPGGLRTGTCAKGDSSQSAPPLLALDMPSPSPLPIVARVEDVADWHAEIFEHLSEARSSTPAIRGNCSFLL